MSLHELIDQRARHATQRAVQLRAGTIATAPDSQDRVMVLVPSDTGRRIRQGPCPVMPRGNTWPARDDRCLVAFDDHNRPWVVCWEPK